MVREQRNNTDHFIGTVLRRIKVMGKSAGSSPALRITWQTGSIQFRLVWYEVRVRLFDDLLLRRFPVTISFKAFNTAWRTLRMFLLSIAHLCFFLFLPSAVGGDMGEPFNGAGWSSAKEKSLKKIEKEIWHLCLVCRCRDKKRCREKNKSFEIWQQTFQMQKDTLTFLKLKSYLTHTEALFQAIFRKAKTITAE